MGMTFKKIIYLFYPFLTIKNILQYTIGGILFYVTFNKISLISFFFGMFSFALSYSFVYTMNDVIDYKIDETDKNKKIIKKSIKAPIITKILPIEQILWVSSLFLIIGIFISLFINSIFSILIIILIIMNIIHSNPIHSFKKANLILIPNMFLIQFIKFSLGWFSQTKEITSFPSWIFILCSLSYVLMYKIYKFNYDFNKMPLKEKLYIIVLIFFSFFAYLISIFLYDIMLPLLITSIVVLISYLMGMRIKKMDLKIKIGFFLIYIVIFFLILPIILIHFNPFLWKMNKQISENIGQNSQVKQFILVLNQSNYELIPMNNSFVNITLDDICKHLSTK